MRQTDRLLEAGVGGQDLEVVRLGISAKQRTRASSPDEGVGIGIEHEDAERLVEEQIRRPAEERRRHDRDSLGLGRTVRRIDEVDRTGSRSEPERIRGAIENIEPPIGKERRAHRLHQAVRSGRDRDDRAIEPPVPDPDDHTARISVVERVRDIVGDEDPWELHRHGEGVLRRDQDEEQDGEAETEVHRDSACRMSSTRSSGSSIPTERRRRLSVSPIASRFSFGTDACVIEAG